MMKNKILKFKSFAFLFLLLLSCVKSEDADLVVHNASIYSFNQQNEIFEAMAIKDGKVIEVGDEHQIMNRYLAKEYIDAKKKVVLPAFADAGITIKDTLSLGFTNGLSFSMNSKKEIDCIIKINYLDFENLKEQIKSRKCFGVYLDSSNFSLNTPEKEELFYNMLNSLKESNSILSIEASLINKNPKAIELIAQSLKGYNDYRWRIENAQLLNPSFYPTLKNFNLIPVIPIFENLKNSSVIKKIEEETGIVARGNYLLDKNYLYDKAEILIAQARINAIALKKENEIGKLEKGFNANFILYKINPFDVNNSKTASSSNILFILGTQK